MARKVGQKVISFDSNGPIRNAFDTGRAITWASGKGLGPGKSRLFWALLNGLEPLGKC
jgi:hypothetical protein